MSDPVSDERQKAYLDKARKGMLTWLSQRDAGTASLADMHQHSSERYLIAHQGFSAMMEGLVAEALVDFDRATMTATLTDAGRRFIA